MINVCPVCNKKLDCEQIQNIYGYCFKFSCGETNTYSKEFDLNIKTNHCINYANEKGEVAFKIIEVIPYIFEIKNNYLNYKQTKIKLIDFDKNNRITKKSSYDGKLRRWIGDLIVLPYILNLNWNNQEEVFNKVKTLLLFS